MSESIVPSYPEKTVERIRVLCTYQGNVNRAYFDNISLVRTGVESMTYDEEGNLTSIETFGEDTDEYAYENGNLTSVDTEAYGDYTYNYDSVKKHQLNSVTGPYLKQQITYDAHGNRTSSVTRDKNNENAVFLKESTAYSTSGNLITSETDGNGITTSYSYGSANNYVLYGVPTTITDANGTILNQTIDEKGRITGIAISNKVGVDYTYDKGNLKEISRTDAGTGKSLAYTFAYDDFGNLVKVKAGNYTLTEYTYGNKNGLLQSQKYGNGSTVSYEYDNLYRDRKVSYSDGDYLQYAYNSEGALARIEAHQGNETRTYYQEFDRLDRPYVTRVLDGTEEVLVISQEYDDSGRVLKENWKLGSANAADTYYESYTYNTVDGEVTSMRTGSGETLNFNYDGLRRLSSVSGGKYTKSFAYKNLTDGQTTRQISELSYTGLQVPLSFAYTYDALGNIQTISDPIVGEKSYTYDALGQMLTETIGSTTYSYTYNNAGNLLTSNTATGNHTYTYGDATWNDLLTAFDGQSISYDNSGNPLSYYNGTRWNFTWEKGRQLKRAVSGSTEISYEYDLSSGMRTKKTVDDTEYEYYYVGDQLVRMTIGDDTVVDFFYDQAGQPYSMKYNGTVYYYILNQQGDVVRIVSRTGASCGIYKYDAWGNILYQSSGTVMSINPMRYRGYVYDEETGFYYVSSRYYDPEVGRFISADTTDILGVSGDLYDKNLYAYCDNNPVIRVDLDGYAWDIALDVASIAVGIGDVIKNPKNPKAWLALGVDTACAFVPFLTGGGAVIRGISKADDAIDAARAIYRASDKASDIRKATGSYVIKFANGKVYVGKGGFKRAINSAKKYGKKSQVLSIDWKKAANSTEAFINEYKDMCKYGGLQSGKLYNKIWSPGRSKYYSRYGKYYIYRGKKY